MSKPLRAAGVALVLGIVAVGCTSGPTVPGTPTAGTSVTSPAISSSTQEPTATPEPSVTTAPPEASPMSTPAPTAGPLEEIALSEPTAFGPAWQELFVLTYGDEPEHLGTSLGGDGEEGIQWGPSYGTQLPDGTWWFLDTAHARLAHFSETGGYLGEVRIPEEFLAGGQYVQYGAPLALADGTVVLQGFTPDDPAMLLLSPDGTLSRVALPEYSVAVKTTDGTFLYGFDIDDDLFRIDPWTGEITQVEEFSGQGIGAYTIAIEPSRIRLTRAGTELVLPVIAKDSPGSSVYPATEAAPGADGVLNLLIHGFVEDEPGEILELAGLVRIDADGNGVVEDVGPLTSPSDPSDGKRLGVRFGDSRPWIMVIGSDGVHVHQWTG